MSVNPLDDVRRTVSEAAAAVRGGGAELAVDPRLERPKRAGLGDFSTNAAMLLAPVLGASPRVIAERLGGELADRMGPQLASWEVAGPGFLNLRLADTWFRAAVGAVLEAGDGFGGGGAGPAADSILIEFVSANPTGPLVAASGRHAAYGDSLARILSHHGHQVWREYYFNDAGNQIRLLGESVQARARGEEVPEGGYQGAYVSELAGQIADAAGRDGSEVAREAVAILLAQITGTLERYGVHYDSFFSERTLHTGSPSRVERVLAALRDSGHVYHSDGADWLRTTSFGDEKDRVVVRSDGTPTYLAADIAYLDEKLERGFDRQLLPVGSDHHAYVRELKAAMGALGADPDRLEVPLLQFVHLVDGSERAAFSKRRGAFVTLDELLDEIGIDATRFFMLRSSHDRTLDLDLDLARSQSAENPVYYVQYAHARIASMLARVGTEAVADAVTAASSPVGDGDAPRGELHPSERGLILKLLTFGDEVAEAVERRAPHRMAAYSLELAQEFTAFYRDCRVVGAEPAECERFRIALSVAAQRTIALALGLLGVSAPDSM
jgi:arginyl-tRNA synthetase